MNRVVEQYEKAGKGGKTESVEVIVKGRGVGGARSQNFHRGKKHLSSAATGRSAV